MDTTSQPLATESFHVLKAARDGFKAIGKRPLPLLGMAFAVNLPPFLCAFLLLGSFLRTHPVDMLSGINQRDLFSTGNIAGLLVWWLGLVLLRPFWIKMCVSRCTDESPTLNPSMYVSFAIANILYLLVFLLCLFVPLLIGNGIGKIANLSSHPPEGVVIAVSLLQSALMAVGIIVMVAALIYLMFFPYLIIDRKQGPLQSLKESSSMVKGIFWKLLGCGVIFSACSWALAAVPFGVVLTDILFGTTTAMIYVRRRQQLKLT